MLNMNGQRKSKRHESNAQRIAQELKKVNYMSSKNSDHKIRRMSKHSLKRHREHRQNARALGMQYSMQHKKRLSAKDSRMKHAPSKEKGNVDPYCDSDIHIIDATHDKALRKIHEQHVKCDENPFISRAFCKKQTDRAVDEIRKKTDKMKKEETQITKQKQIPFECPGTPDTAVGPSKLAADPKFNEKWTNCFAGPQHSTCNCNFVMRNDSNPQKMDCSYGSTINKNSFYPQQRLVAEYIHPNTPYRGLLCYHGLGSGKTLVMIGVLAKFLQYEPTRTIIVLAPPKLIQNFYDDLAKTETTTLFGDDAKSMTDEERERRIHRQLNVKTFEEIANRLNGRTRRDLPANRVESQKQRNNENIVTVGRGFGALPEGTVQSDTPEEPLLNNTLIMIDEAHDLVTPHKASYPPIDKAYSVVSAMKRATDCRILLMTATPMRDDPYELGILLNMLKPPQSTTKFPEVIQTKKMDGAQVDIVDLKETQKLFDNEFILSDDTGMQMMQNEDTFLHRCQGLISYFPVDNLFTKFPKHREYMVEVHMPDDVYAVVREKMNTEAKAIQTKKQGKYGSILDHKLSCLTSRRASNILGHTKRLIASEIANKTNGRTPKINAVAKTIEQNYMLGKQFVYSFFDTQGCIALSLRLQSWGWKKLECKDLFHYLKQAYRKSINIRKESFAEKFNLPLDDPDCARLK